VSGDEVPKKLKQNVDTVHILTLTIQCPTGGGVKLPPDRFHPHICGTDNSRWWSEKDKTLTLLINFFCSLIIASVKLQPQPKDYTVLHTMFFFPRLPHARKLLTFCAAMLNLLFLKSWAALASTTFLAANLLRRRCDWFYTDRQLSPGDSWHV